MHTDDSYIYTTIHDFKTNFSKYIRMLRKGPWKAVVVSRYKEDIGFFFLRTRLRPAPLAQKDKSP